MANLDQLGLPNGSTYNFKDNTQERSDHRHYGSDTIPLVHKLYESTSYYATSANDWATSTWYFMSIKPDDWYKPWRVKFKVHSYCPSYTNVNSYTWAEYTGRADAIAYANWNEKYDNAHYYTPYYPLKKAGFDAGYGHAVGISILYGTGYTTASYYRTFEIDYYECENCTVTILDTPVKWANWTGTGTTNYGSLGAPDACTRGLCETNDANTVTENRIAYFSGKTGSKGIWNGSLFMEDSDGTYQAICTASDGTVTSSNRTTATTKIANTNGFKVLGTIWYCNTNYNANTNISGSSVVYSAISIFDSRYSFNTTLTANSLTPYKEVYLVGTINSNGLFYLDNPWWTQTPTDPTKVYVLVGACFDSTTSNCRITLYEQNKWYRYSGSNLIEIANDARTVNGHTVAKDVPSNAVFTDTQANWTQTTSTALDYIKNKPTLGTASAKDVPASGNASTSQVVMGNDTRLSDARTPTSHSHGNIANGGTITSTAVTPANTDYLLMSDASNSGKIERGVAIGTDTTKYLRNDGTWQVPPNDNTDIKVRQTLNTENNNYPLLMSYALTSTTTANIDNVSYRNSSIYANPAKGSIVATTVRAANTYYGISFGKTTSTVTESILYTGIQWINSTHMPVIHLKGYAFNNSEIVDLQVGFYIYNNNIGWCGVSNCGAWAPDIYAFKYTKSSVDYVAIGLKGSIGYLLIQADVSDELNKFGKISTNPSDWTWTFTSTATIPTPDSGVTCIKATYTADILKDTTYTLGTSGNNVTLTPAGGTAQSITVPYATSAGSATKATQDESGNNIKATYANSFSISDHTITLKNKNGASLGTVTVPDNNTTYTFANGTNGFTVTPSGGTAQTVTVTPSITNNVTGSGTSGYIVKWNGTNTITNGPAFGSTTTTYLNNAGSWATPPDTKNTAGSTDTSSKIFLIGATSQAANPQTYSDDQVYATNGTLSAAAVSTGIVGVTATNGTSGGISLYSGTGYVTNYGIAMRTTANSGKHGYVQGDWAHYFYMDGATNRGLVFKQAGAAVASVSGLGHAVFNGSVTIGGNTTNTSGCRLEYDSSVQAVNFVFN